MRHFFITGLPRSRTSWLAAVFCAGPVRCWHDALDDSLKPQALVTRFSRLAMEPGVTHVGDSDSALLCFPDAVQVMYPEAPWVFVVRPRADAEASFRKYFAAHNPYALPGLEKVDIGQIFDELAVREAEARRVITNKLEVEFAGLNDNATIKRIWNWCVPGVDYPAGRIELMQGLQVNPFPQKTKVTRA